jgi:Domain of unknown function (DUF4184)
MPFTFSHPAIVLPLNYLPKRFFSLTALVIGSITPDFEYFIRMKMSAPYSHNWPGLFWFDLPLSLLLILVYNKVVKNKLIDHLPTHLNARFSGLKSSPKPYFKPNLIIVILSVLIGTASHLLWDDFTHWSGYFVIHIPVLTRKLLIFHHEIAVFKVLQHLSTLTGALVILYAITQLPVGKLTNSGNIIYYWIKIAGITVLALVIRVFAGLNLQQYGDVIVSGISGIMIGLIIVSVITPRNKLNRI